MKYLTVAVLIAMVILTINAGQKKNDKKEETKSKPQPAAVSFSKDVLPVLTKKCLDCHTTEDESSNKFYVDNYEALFMPAKHGAAIVPGKGEESILIKKIRGTADFGKAMPKKGSPVPDSVTAMISKWIDQGAKKN